MRVRSLSECGLLTVCVVLYPAVWPNPLTHTYHTSRTIPSFMFRVTSRTRSLSFMFRVAAVLRVLVLNQPPSLFLVLSPSPSSRRLLIKDCRPHDDDLPCCPKCCHQPQKTQTDTSWSHVLQKPPSKAADFCVGK